MNEESKNEMFQPQDLGYFAASKGYRGGSRGGYGGRGGYSAGTRNQDGPPAKRQGTLVHHVTSARPWALPPHILHQSVENGLTQLNETQPTPPLLTYQPWTLLTSCLQSPSSS